MPNSAERMGRGDHPKITSSSSKTKSSLYHPNYLAGAKLRAKRNHWPIPFKATGRMTKGKRLFSLSRLTTDRCLQVPACGINERKTQYISNGNTVGQGQLSSQDHKSCSNSETTGWIQSCSHLCKRKVNDFGSLFLLPADAARPQLW